MSLYCSQPQCNSQKTMVGLIMEMPNFPIFKSFKCTQKQGLHKILFLESAKFVIFQEPHDTRKSGLPWDDISSVVIAELDQCICHTSTKQTTNPHRWEMMSLDQFHGRPPSLLQVQCRLQYKWHDKRKVSSRECLLSTSQHYGQKEHRDKTVQSNLEEE